MNAKRKHDLEHILNATPREGPSVVKKLGIRLKIDEAEDICRKLQRQGFDIQPYDFPGTYSVWQSNNKHGVPYSRVATKQLVQKLAEEAKIDCTTAGGFKQLLPYFTQKTFKSKAINRWGTTLSGMFRTAYSSSPAKAIIDLVENDKEFRVIQKAGIHPYDFPEAPNHYWKNNRGKPTYSARLAAKELVKTLAVKYNADYKTLNGFLTILPYFTRETFRSTEINVWGTKLGSMLSNSYGSPKSAIRDLLSKDSEFSDVAAQLRKVAQFLPGIIPKRTSYSRL